MTIVVIVALVRSRRCSGASSVDVSLIDRLHCRERVNDQPVSIRVALALGAMAHSMTAVPQSTIARTSLALVIVLATLICSIIGRRRW